MVEEKLLIELLEKLLGDSIRVSEEAGEQLIQICKKRFEEIYEVYKKNGSEWTYDEYFPGHGSFSISRDQNENALVNRDIYLEYSDSWGYGGYCEFYMNITFDQFKDSYLEELDKSLRKTKIASIKDQIKLIEKSLIEKKELLSKLMEEN